MSLPAFRRTRARAAAAVLLIVASTLPLGAQDVLLDVHAPARLSAAAGRLRASDYSALRRTLEAAGLRFPERISATLVATDDERVARIPPWVVGLASGTEHVMIFPERIGPYPYDSLESVMRHEIVHLALNDRAGGRPLPRWFHEGVAVTLESGWSTRDDLRLLLAALDPPSMADIARLFASDAYPDTTQAYLLSAALVDDIRNHHGSGAIGGIAQQFAAGLSFEAAFAAATGESVDTAADRAWRGHRRLSRWVPVLTSPSAAWTLIMALAAVAFVVRLRRVRELRRRWEEEEEADEEEKDAEDLLRPAWTPDRDREGRE